MQKKLSKTKENLASFFKKLPFLASKHFTYFVLGGAILMLLLGTWVFYGDAYAVTNDSYDVFVTVRKVNSTLFEEAKEYLQIDLERGALPSRNPFQP